MTKLEYPNGYFYMYKAILCREDYCYGCEKYLRNVLSTRKDEVKDWTRDVWESRSVVKTSLFAKFFGLFSLRQSGIS